MKTQTTAKLATIYRYSAVVIYPAGRVESITGNDLKAIKREIDAICISLPARIYNQQTREHVSFKHGGVWYDHA